jgi:ATP synthase protein I
VIPLANGFNYYLEKERRKMAGNQKSWQKAVMVGSNIATSLAGLVGGGFLLGSYLDARWGTRPWLTLSLMLAGLALGVSYLVITLKEFGDSDDKK